MNVDLPVKESFKTMNNTGKISILLSLVLVMLCGSFQWSCSQDPANTKPLEVGDKAANFSLLEASGRTIKLADIQPGWYLVLFFYRGAWCGTCVNHLLNFKQNTLRYTVSHAALAAVSVDKVEDSAALNGQWRFPFPLLSDTQFKLIDAYGLRDPKQGHKGEDISHVAVVIIDPQRIVRYKYVGKEAWDRPSDDEIIDKIQKLQMGTPIPTSGGTR